MHREYEGEREGVGQLFSVEVGDGQIPEQTKETVDVRKKKKWGGEERKERKERAKEREVKKKPRSARSNKEHKHSCVHHSIPTLQYRGLARPKSSRNIIVCLSASQS